MQHLQASVGIQHHPGACIQLDELSKTKQWLFFSHLIKAEIYCADCKEKLAGNNNISFSPFYNLYELRLCGGVLPCTITPDENFHFSLTAQESNLFIFKAATLAFGTFRPLSL